MKTVLWAAMMIAAMVVVYFFVQRGARPAAALPSLAPAALPATQQASAESPADTAAENAVRLRHAATMDVNQVHSDVERVLYIERPVWLQKYPIPQDGPAATQASAGEQLVAATPETGSTVIQEKGSPAPTTVPATASATQKASPEDFADTPEENRIRLQHSNSELRQVKDDLEYIQSIEKPAWLTRYTMPQDDAATHAATQGAGEKADVEQYSGYFVNNTFEPAKERSLVVAASQAEFDKIFGAGFVMNDKSHRLPAHVWETQLVAAVIQRGPAVVTYSAVSATVKEGVLTVNYRATVGNADRGATYATPLIVSVPRAGVKSVRFVEEGKEVGVVGVK